MNPYMTLAKRSNDPVKRTMYAIRRAKQRRQLNKEWGR